MVALNPSSAIAGQIHSINNSLRTNNADFYLNSQRQSNRIFSIHKDPFKAKALDKCGVMAIVSQRKDNLGFAMAEGLNRLQHRGQKATALAYASSGGKIIRTPQEDKDCIGLVSEVFKSQDLLRNIRGRVAIGHTLYPTSANKDGDCRPQPIIPNSGKSKLAFAHNGNLANLEPLKKILSQVRPDFKQDKASDSAMMAELIDYFYLENNGKLKEAITSAKPYFEGAYSCVVVDKDRQLGVFRDPNGIRPLTLGIVEVKNHPDMPGDTFYKAVVASETSAFGPLNARIVRDIAPDEILVLDKDFKLDDLKLPQEFTNSKQKICALEPIYLMRPDSIYNGRSVSEHRRESGKVLAEEFKARHPEVNIDCVIPVVESGLASATGLAEGLKVPVNPALIKNFHRRTFIDGGDKVRSKFTVIPDSIKGKDIAVVDDSIVKGNTSKAIVELLKTAKPASVHFISASPPLLFADYYGIDNKYQKDLLAAQENNNWQNISKIIGADSVTFISLDGLRKSFGVGKEELQDAHFTGNYPTRFERAPGDTAKTLSDFAKNPLPNSPEITQVVLRKLLELLKRNQTN